MSFIFLQREIRCGKGVDQMSSLWQQPLEKKV